MSLGINGFFPELICSDPLVEKAWRVALGDLLGNIRPYQAGLLEEPRPVLLAGLDYDTPWTRDAAINVWNGVGLLWPDVARDTLASVLERRGAQLRIGGQYWDAILWSQGAWAYYLYTGDYIFLREAHRAVCASLEALEMEEFDPQFGLFRGPAVYGDGVAAYPDRYCPGGTSAILDWPAHNPQQKAESGYGLPMMCLSTNAAYANAYRLANAMAAELRLPLNPTYTDCADALTQQIQNHFWNEQAGRFAYLLDGEGHCDAQEGLGHAFVMLFNLTRPGQNARILDCLHTTPQGIACLWPSFSRYQATPDDFGRHSGTIWPFINAFWAEAAQRNGRLDLFDLEFRMLTRNLCRDGQCAEIYHPVNGLPYGGIQEAGGGTSGREWRSCLRQSWSASGYLRMVLKGLLGMHFTPEGIHFTPALPPGIERLELRGLPCRDAELNIVLSGNGNTIREFRWKDTPTRPFLPLSLRGEQQITIELGE